MDENMGKLNYHMWCHGKICTYHSWCHGRLVPNVDGNIYNYHRCCHKRLVFTTGGSNIFSGEFEGVHSSKQ